MKKVCNRVEVHSERVKFRVVDGQARWMEPSTISPAFKAKIEANAVLSQNGTISFDTLYEKAIRLADDNGIQPSNEIYVSGQHGLIYQIRPREANTFHGPQHIGKSSKENFVRQNCRLQKLRSNPGLEPHIYHWLKANGSRLYTRYMMFTSTGNHTITEINSALEGLCFQSLREAKVDGVTLTNVMAGNKKGTADTVKKIFQNTHERHAMLVLILAHFHEERDVAKEMKMSRSKVGRFGAFIKKFECLSCGRKYVEQKTLYDHIQRNHVELQPFACDLCSERFVTEERKKKTHGCNSRAGKISRKEACVRKVFGAVCVKICTADASI